MDVFGPPIVSETHNHRLDSSTHNWHLEVAEGPV